MTQLIVKGKEFTNSFGVTDVDFRFHKEDGTPIMIRGGVNGDGKEYHAGQISSSFNWAIKDACENYNDRLSKLFPEGYSLYFDFIKLNGDKF